MNRFDRRAGCAIVCFLLGLSGCGGGGNGGDALTVTFEQSPLQVTAYQWDVPDTVNVNAVVHGSTSASTIYVFIVDQGSTFSNGPAQISQISPGIYQTTLSLPASTAIGEHDGNLQLRICADSACNSVLNTSTLPYKVTMKSNPALQAVASPATLVGSGVSQGSSSTGNFTALGLRLPAFTFQGTPVYPVYVRATDSAGILSLPYNEYSTGNSNIAGPFSQDNFQLSFIGGDTLAPGTYSGVLTFTFCHDEQCTKVFGGSSSLPYTLTYTATNLTNLTAVANAPDWQGVDGGSSHNGSVPMTVSEGSLVPRWLVSAHPNGNDGYSADPHLLTGGGKVYLNDFVITALNEADGTVAWSGGTYAKAPLSSANSTIYMQNTTLYGIAETDGRQLFANSNAQNGLYSAGPVAIGNKVLQQEVDLEIDGFNGQTGAAEGAPSCLQSIEQTKPGLNPLPAMDSQLNAYITTGTGLVVANFGANPVCSQIATPNASTGLPMYVAANSEVLVNIESALVDFNTKNSTINWTKQISLPQSLVGDDNAVAGGVIYALVNNPFASAELQAYSEANGQLLWTWTLPEPFQEGSFQLGMIVTNNVVFVQGYNHVYAVDLSSHQAVWSLSVAGAMALSANGVLYVNSGWPVQSRLVAVNLH